MARILALTHLDAVHRRAPHLAGQSPLYIDPAGHHKYYVPLDPYMATDSTIPPDFHAAHPPTTGNTVPTDNHNNTHHNNHDNHNNHERHNNHDNHTYGHEATQGVHPENHPRQTQGLQQLLQQVHPDNHQR